MTTAKIIYEPHPVSAARKAELKDQGYKILDACFAPDGYKHPDAKKKAKTETPPTEPT